MIKIEKIGWVPRHIAGAWGLLILGLFPSTLASGRLPPDAPSGTAGHAPVALTLPCLWSSGTRLAKRQGAPACWVRQDELCIPHALWLRWLNQSDPSPWCGTIQGRWRVSAPLANAPYETHLKIAVRTWQAAELSRRSPGSENTLFFHAVHWIERIREETSQTLAHDDPWGFLRSMLLDERIPGAPTGMLGTLGFAHLMAASGIHLYAVSCLWGAALSFVALGVGLSAWQALTLSRFAVLLSWAFAWALTGARAGMLRPWLIWLTRQVAELLGMRWRAGAPLVLALAFDGVAGWALGQGESSRHGRIYYALSVGGALMFLGRGGSKHDIGKLGLGKSILRAGSFALGAWILPALWSAWSIGTIALLGPLWSLLTLPALTFLAYPALLISGLSCALGTRLELPWIWRAMDFWINLLASWAVALPQLWVVPRESLALGAVLATGAVGVMGTTRVLSRLGWGRGTSRLAPLLLCLFPATAIPVALFLKDTPSAGSCEFLNPGSCANRVEQLDVGQGDAALIAGPKGVAGLFDAGSERALGDPAWIRLLATRGIREISWIALSHLDEDHSGGVKRLGTLVPIGCVVTSRGELLSERGERYAQELRGLGIRSGEWSAACMPFPYYAPPPTPPGAGGLKNQNMGALLVPLPGGKTYLAAGDADQAEELPIGRWARDWLATHERPGARRGRILKISHHGSRTSSHPDFIRAFQPTQAWISVGINNHYGHPSAQVLDLLGKMGIPVGRTDRDGSLSTQSDLLSSAFK